MLPILETKHGIRIWTRSTLAHIRAFPLHRTQYEGYSVCGIGKFWCEPCGVEVGAYFLLYRTYE